MKRTYADYLQDIIDNCELAASFVAGVDFEQFQISRPKSHWTFVVLVPQSRQFPVFEILVYDPKAN